MMIAFSDVFADVTKQGTKLQTSEYLASGKYPIIDQGQDDIAGYTDREDGLFTDVPAIIFGDHTRIVKYVDMPFFLGADGVKVLKATIPDVDYRYLYYAVSAVKIPNTGYNRHFKWLKEAQISLPDLPTQRWIADTLDKVAEGIGLCRKMLGKLDLMVKAKFGEMFGALGEDKFNWGMTTLGVCCELNPKRPRDIPDDMDVSFVAMPSVTEKGQIDTSVIKPYLEVRKGFTYFAENDVLFAKITPCMENGKGCVAKGLTNAIGAGSTEFHVLRPIHGKSNPYWLYYLTVIPGFRENARKVMTGTGGQLRVPIAYLDNLPVSLPPIELQEQFATFVSKIDKSRLTIQQVLSKMEMVKLALMQEYFG